MSDSGTGTVVHFFADNAVWCYCGATSRAVNVAMGRAASSGEPGTARRDERCGGLCVLPANHAEACFSPVYVRDEIDAEAEFEIRQQDPSGYDRIRSPGSAPSGGTPHVHDCSIGTASIHAVCVCRCGATRIAGQDEGWSEARGSAGTTGDEPSDERLRLWQRRAIKAEAWLERIAIDPHWCFEHETGAAWVSWYDGVPTANGQDMLEQCIEAAFARVWSPGGTMNKDFAAELKVAREKRESEVATLRREREEARQRAAELHEALDADSGEYDDLYRRFKTAERSLEEARAALARIATAFDGWYHHEFDSLTGSEALLTELREAIDAARALPKDAT